VSAAGAAFAVAVLSTSDAHLRRAQAFAVTNQTGREIARYLLCEKVCGQERVLHRLTKENDLRDAFAAAARLFEEGS
jgi:hypothetical protein